MSTAGRLHGRYVHDRRIRVLTDRIASLIPPNARVLDVGSGDGLLAAGIRRRRPDTMIRGIDVLVRPQTHIPVDAFDGRNIPYADRSFDVVMCVDVLHHTPDPMVLLREAARTAKWAIVLKDHDCSRPLAIPTLRFMDRVGNARHGVALPYNYWPRRQWQEAFKSLGLFVASWTEDLGLYPAPASLLFGGTLQFMAVLETRR